MAGVSSDERQAAAGSGAPEGYAELTREAGLYDDGSRRVLAVRGDRSLRALNGLVTADVLAVERDAAFPTLILTPKGRVLADAVIVRVGDGVWLDVPESAWPDLESHFDRYLPPRFARLEPSNLRVLRIRGPLALEPEGSDPRLSGLDGPEYTAQDGSRWSAAPLDGGFAVRPPEGLDLYLPPGETPDPAVPEVGETAWEVFRIENGIPLYGRDVSLDNLPQETGLVPERVSFRKGCYTGQEILARIHYRGKVNRHLRGLRGDATATAGAPLHAGDELVVDGKEVGVITSAVVSPVHGPIALAYVRREIEPGDDVVVRPGGRETDIPLHARVTTLPFVESG